MHFNIRTTTVMRRICCSSPYTIFVMVWELYVFLKWEKKDPEPCHSLHSENAALHFGKIVWTALIYSGIFLVVQRVQK